MLTWLCSCVLILLVNIFLVKQNWERPKILKGMKSIKLHIFFFFKICQNSFHDVCGIRKIDIFCSGSGEESRVRCRKPKAAALISCFQLPLPYQTAGLATDIHSVWSKNNIPRHRHPISLVLKQLFRGSLCSLL